MPRKPTTRSDRYAMECKLKDMFKSERTKFLNMQKEALKYMVENKILMKALELACNTSKFEDTCDYCAYKGELEITNDCPRWCETDEKFFVTQAMGYFIREAKEIIHNES